MAGADYLRCERCGDKAIYDADWSERVGEYQVVAALCDQCSNAHTLEVVVRTVLVADAVVIPSVDYTKIPQEYEGKWVLVRIKDQQVVSVADSPKDAMEGFDSESFDLVLTKVPRYGADAETLELADLALKALDKRKDEPIEEWADNLARDVADAND